MKRFFSMILDLILVQILFYLILFPLFFANSSFNSALPQVSSITLFLVYNLICDSAFERVTIGKKILRIRTQFLFDEKKTYCYLHGILRLFFFYLLPFTAIFYIFIGKGKLPYDIWFETETVNEGVGL